MSSTLASAKQTRVFRCTTLTQFERNTIPKWSQFVPPKLMFESGQCKVYEGEACIRGRRANQTLQYFSCLPVDVVTHAQLFLMKTCQQTHIFHSMKLLQTSENISI